MDSLSQIVLGAAVGEACLGKKVGNKAPLWGAIAGTIPDLDVLASIFQGEFQYLVAHRGLTHSIFFCVLVAPMLGWLIHRYYRKYRNKEEASARAWTILAFWALFTHPLLDCFTSWGTQLFYPFSDYRVAFNTIFVADPLYTVPFLICLLTALYFHRENKWRRYWNWIGIGISSFYLLITVINKATVDRIFAGSLHESGNSIYRFSSYPAPLNNLLWYVVAEGPSELLVGYHSLLGDPQNIRYVHIPKNHDLIELDDSNYIINRLKWLSKGYFSLNKTEEGVFWNDIRFGIANLFTGMDKAPEYIFSFRLLEKEGEIYGIKQIGPPREFEGFNPGDYWEKMMGRQ